VRDKVRGETSNIWWSDHIDCVSGGREARGRQCLSTPKHATNNRNKHQISISTIPRCADAHCMRPSNKPSRCRQFSDMHGAADSMGDTGSSRMPPRFVGQ
jgi:hypothetical protein